MSYLPKNRPRQRLPAPVPRLVRKSLDHTSHDQEIVAHLPPWLRADYKVADRIAADQILELL